ncbi:MAG: hypothetical protein FWF54_09840 [Candidatus Azobacteroides sp.]|nr:hypothetical protein [Candidatus Azobacteroides sp.]
MKTTGLSFIAALAAVFAAHGTGKRFSGRASVALLAFVWAPFAVTSAFAQTYHPGDIAVINAIIDNNGLQWTKAPTDGGSVPSDWTGVTWSNDGTKRITGLDISSQSLTGALDVSGLTNLQTLKCGENSLIAMNVSGLTALQTLWCWVNSLTALDVSRLSDLRDLYCSNNNLTALDVSGCTGLQYLGCPFNNLTALDASGLSNLRGLYCNNNSLTTLNVSGLTGLQSLECFSNNLTAVDLSGLPDNLHFDGSNQRINLILTGNAGIYTADVTFGTGVTFGDPALSYSGGVLRSTYTPNTSSFSIPTGLTGRLLEGTLSLGYQGAPGIYHPGDIAVINAIIDNNGLQLTKAPADGSSLPSEWIGVTVWSNDGIDKRITDLDISSQSLTGTLDVSELINLQALNCYNNGLTALDLSELTNLRDLSCSNNDLTALDLSGLIGLQSLACEGNSLTALDVSELTNLRDLSCSNNGLTALDLSGLINLQALNCYNNGLTALDLSGLINLWWLACDGNSLTTLDLSELSGLVGWSFFGYNQQVNLSLTGSADTYTANGIPFDAGVTFDDPALSYIAGVLTSNSADALSSAFTSPTGLTGKLLQGTLNLTYLTNQEAVDAAADLMENVSYTVAEVIANTEDAVKARLVDYINNLIRYKTGLTVTADDITVTGMMPASAGTNGSFTFSVALESGESSVIIEGTGIITAAYASGINTPQATGLEAYVQNGTLHVSGLVAGEMWNVYNISGICIHRDIAKGDKTEVSLPVRGIYIVKSGNRTVKVLY